MLLSVDSDDPVPIYQQVRDSIVPIYQQVRNRIVEAIAVGELPAGSGLPSIRQLAADLGINVHTMNKAYDLLRRQGLLRIGRKAGAVVQRDAAGGPPRSGREQDWVGRLRTLLAEAAAQGLPADGIIRHCQAAVARFASQPGRPTPLAGREPGHDTGGPDRLSRRPAVHGADGAGPEITRSASNRRHPQTPQKGDSRCQHCLGTSQSSRCGCAGPPFPGAGARSPHLFRAVPDPVRGAKRRRPLAGRNPAAVALRWPSEPVRASGRVTRRGSLRVLGDSCSSGLGSEVSCRSGVAGRWRRR
jgi:GntR family transcriptional regulator